MSAPDSAPVARRWRFSIRFLLLACAVVAVTLAIVLQLTKEYRRRLAIRADLMELGATHAVVLPGNRIRVLFTTPLTAADLAKHREIQGLEFKQTRIGADSLRHLNGLDRVDLLILDLCTLDSPDALAPLAQVGRVRSLLIWNTPVTDAAIDDIAAIPGLERLDLHRTAVTPAGLDRLRTLRPEIEATLR